MFQFCFNLGWIDDHMKDDVWKNKNAQPHAFTTGRPRPNPNPNSTFGGAGVGGKKVPPAVRPRGVSQTLKQPGKLNLKSYAIVNEALARMNLGDNNKPVLDKKFLYTPGSKKLLPSKNTKSKSRDKMHAAPGEGNDNVGGDDQDYEEAEYETVNDGFSEAVNNIASQLFSFSSQDQQNSMRNKLRQRREKEQQSK